VHPEYAALLRHVDGCLARGRLDEAEPALRAIVAANPREHYAWSLLGLAALKRGDADAALPLLQRALSLDRNNAGYLNHLGVAYGELGRFDEALAALRKAVRARAANAEAHFNTGKVFDKLGDLPAARDAFRRAAALDPRYPGARAMLGRTLRLLGDPEAAVQVLEEAVAADPGDEWSIIQLGRALVATRGIAAAIALYRDAAARLPQSGMLARNLAHALLAAGDFRAGWRAYVRRDLAGPVPRATPPDALPADLRGRRVLLRPEQGLGDILFFLRFAPALAERGARVTVVAPAKVAPLLGRIALFATVLEAPPPPGEHDFEATIGDLPYLTGADVAPPSLAIDAHPERVAAWRSRLAGFGPPPHVGLTWRAGTDFRRRAEFGANIQSLHKEAPLDGLAASLRVAAGTFVSLQRGADAGEVDRLTARLGRPILDAGAANEDLEDALAVLAVLDDYVCVSNTNVHLRAMLGAGARVLVPFPPEWRWMAEGDASPWFPGSRVYREGGRGDWRPALEELARDLAAATPSGSIARS
jgi:tetratricopeptide (TPR) repeat protein